MSPCSKTPILTRPPRLIRLNRARQRGAFSLVEVLVAAVIMSIAMGNVVTISMRAADALRTSREAAASSQVLQQRIEAIRDRPWPEVSCSEGLAEILKTPTDSESELSDPQVMETMRVTVPMASSSGLVEGKSFLSVYRKGGVVVIEQSGDFVAEPTLLFEGSLVWRDRNGVHRRVLRTVVCRFGLTRGGILGSMLGRPASRVSKSGGSAL